MLETLRRAFTRPALAIAACFLASAAVAQIQPQYVIPSIAAFRTHNYNETPLVNIAGVYYAYYGAGCVDDGVNCIHDAGNNAYVMRPSSVNPPSASTRGGVYAQSAPPGQVVTGVNSDGTLAFAPQTAAPPSPPGTTTLGGVFLQSAPPNEFVTGINGDGSLAWAQPNIAGLGGLLGCGQIPTLLGDVTNSGCTVRVGSLNSGAVNLSAITGAQGNGPKIQLGSGTPTSGDLSKYDASGNVVDSGIAASFVANIDSILSGVTGAQGNGSKVQLATGTTTTGDVPKYDANGNVVDSTVALSALAPLNSPSFTGAIAMPDGSTWSSASGLTMVGGLTVPTTAVGNLYLDGTGALHVKNSNGDFAGIGAKASGDTSRSWFTNPFGSWITESVSGGLPNMVCDRQDYYTGGSGVLDECLWSTITVGKGVTVKPNGYVATGTTGPFGITANVNIAVGQAVYGPGIPNGDTVAAYTTGQLTLTLATIAPLYSNEPINIINASNSTPQSSSIANQGTCQVYTTQTSSAQTCNGANGYVFKNAPSTAIIEGGNILCNDQTGLPSLTAGACVGVEEDVVAEDQDTGLSRLVEDLIVAEGGPSANPASFGYIVRMRPGGANAQYVGQNPAHIINGIIAATMSPIPGVTAAGGEFGYFDEAFKCDGGETIGCFDAVAGSLTYSPSVSAPSGQSYMLFTLGKNINTGQTVTGVAGIPTGETVASVYQCDASHQRSECGSITGSTLVNLTLPLTGTVSSSASVVFGGSFVDGSRFSGNFTDAFVNWTNQFGTGVIKAGSALTSGTMLDVQGLGEDSTSTVVDYGDLSVKSTSNTHGSIVGSINLAPAGNGTVTLGSQNLPTAKSGALLQGASQAGSPSRVEMDAYAATAFFSGTRADGTVASPTAVQSGDLLADINGAGQYDTTTGHTGLAAALHLYAEGAFSSTSWPGEACLATVPSGSTTIADGLCQHNDGGVTVGSPTGGDKGAGSINAQAIYVQGVAVGTGGGGSGTVTTTGTPASGELAAFSGASSITNGNLSGDCSTANTLAVTCSPLLHLSGGTMTGTVTFADGGSWGSSGFTLGASSSFNNKSVTGANVIQAQAAHGPTFDGAVGMSSTQATFFPDRTDVHAGICGDTPGDISLCADNAGATLEILRVKSTGMVLESGTFTGTDSGTWGSGGINGSIIGGTTPAAGSFTSLSASGTVSGSGFSSYLASPPAIGGAAAAAGTFTTLTHTGHEIEGGTAQACSNVTFGTSAGTSPTCNSVTGDDQAFNINFTEGSSPVASSTIFTLAFNNGTFSTAPVCVFAAVGGNTATAISKFDVSSTTTGVSISNTSSALTASIVYNLNVICR